MKNTIIWFSGILIGGLIGYGIGLINSASAYLWMGIGVILGSSIAITYNIHRENNDMLDMNDIDSEEVSESMEDKEENSATNRQKVS